MIELERERKRKEREEREAKELRDVHGADWRNKSMEFLCSHSGAFKVLSRE
jgi:hypothetical protein